MLSVAMAFLFTGAQLPILLYGTVSPFIIMDIGDAHGKFIWFVLAHMIATASISPFVGSLSDQIGRKYVALLGAFFIILGSLISSTASNISVLIGGMVVAGIGSGIAQVAAIAVTCELNPRPARGKAIALLLLLLIPISPAAMYSHLVAKQSSWRHVGYLPGGWTFLGMILTSIFYYPRPIQEDYREGLKKVDFVGGILSTLGVAFLLIGLQWGAFMQVWKTTRALVPLLLGIIGLGSFVCWEMYGPENPILPKRLRQDTRTLGIALFIMFIAGANTVSGLMFWPVETFNIYDQSAVAIGLKTLALGLAVATGAIVMLFLISFLKGRARELLVVSTVFTVIGSAGLVKADRDNMDLMWFPMIVMAFGLGGSIIPTLIITTIVCPDDLVGTITGLATTVRIVGSGIGYCVYQNIFLNKLGTAVTHHIPEYLFPALNITDASHWDIEEVLEVMMKYTSGISDLPTLADMPTMGEHIKIHIQLAFVDTYKWVYFSSLGFGIAGVVAAFFIKDIHRYMNDRAPFVG
ncbi:MFS drug efflux pump [Patellaria atrata CBS 101060]|uniref:MFS drug efflux pump n=1 Tax=Patellaria atrata CBS 101060 TaxID=1346257 RepID=A0A9P4SDS5_9PEZI|nr:MFS drug efflux pump [Patellaria atrata CBS 101060]